jgi:hypothetical protein
MHSESTLENTYSGFESSLDLLRDQLGQIGVSKAGSLREELVSLLFQMESLTDGESHFWSVRTMPTWMITRA